MKNLTIAGQPIWRKGWSVFQKFVIVYSVTVALISIALCLSAVKCSGQILANPQLVASPVHHWEFPMWDVMDVTDSTVTLRRGTENAWYFNNGNKTGFLFWTDTSVADPASITTSKRPSHAPTPAQVWDSIKKSAPKPITAHK